MWNNCFRQSLCGFLMQRSFSLGLWIGVGVAVFMAWHIRYSLEDALDMSGGRCLKHMYRMYGIRMAVVLVVFLLPPILRSAV